LPRSSIATRIGDRQPRILAVDGGDSKTDVVLVEGNGRVLGAKRVRLSSHLGLDRVGATDALEAAIRSACRSFDVDPDRRPIADIGVYCLAGADLPVDERRIHRELAARGWTQTTLVRNDTLAVLRAGTDRGWGVAIVCGSGMNAAGVAPDGRVVRFAALGEISGDLAAGGGWIGMMALAHAVRAEDGRGQKTLLERLVPAFFKLSKPSAVSEAMYLGRINQHRLVELAPLVFDAALRRDRVAREILDRVADETVAFALAAIKRLRLARRDVEVVLGGGIFRANDGGFEDRIRERIHEVAPRAVISRLKAPPVAGAALIGLDQLGASRSLGASVRRAVSDSGLVSLDRNGGRSTSRSRGAS
jgi:N-acetylglucosamine kinase-like BadF-type ATPase